MEVDEIRDAGKIWRGRDSSGLVEVTSDPSMEDHT